MDWASAALVGVAPPLDRLITGMAVNSRVFRHRADLEGGDEGWVNCKWLNGKARAKPTRVLYESIASEGRSARYFILTGDLPGHIQISQTNPSGVPGPRPIYPTLSPLGPLDERCFSQAGVRRRHRPMVSKVATLHDTGRCGNAVLMRQTQRHCEPAICFPCALDDREGSQIHHPNSATSLLALVMTSRCQRMAITRVVLL